MLINKVNRMIRQLSKFASEVTRVAQEGAVMPAVAIHRTELTSLIVQSERKVYWAARPLSMVFKGPGMS